MENLISPEILGYIVAGVIILERIAKFIPDDATGLLGIVRKVSKILSAYVPNDEGQAPQKFTGEGDKPGRPPIDPPTGP